MGAVALLCALNTDRKLGMNAALFGGVCDACWLLFELAVVAAAGLKLAFVLYIAYPAPAPAVPAMDAGDWYGCGLYSWSCVSSECFLVFGGGWL